MVSFIKLRNRCPGIRDSRGIAIVEFALILPFLALVLIGMVEWGRMLTQYLNTVQMANDAVNVAARTHGLVADTVCETDGSGTPCAAGNHMPAHMRAQVLMGLQGAQIHHDDPTVTSYRSFLNSANQTVMFSISSEFVSLFPAFFNHIPFSVQVTGPYLPGTGLNTGLPVTMDTGMRGGGEQVHYVPIDGEIGQWGELYLELIGGKGR